MKQLLLLLMSSVLLVCCTKYEEQDLPVSFLNNQGAIFHATMESRQDESRTYLDQGNHQLWHAEDEIALYYGSTQKRQYRFMGKTGDPEGDFEEISVEKEEGRSLENNHAFYPYSMVYDFTGEYKIKIPAVQTFAPGGTFAQGSNPMVAITESVEDTELKFKNICGYLKLKLYGDNITVKQIILSNNSGNFKRNCYVEIKDGIGYFPNSSWYDTDGQSYYNENILLDCGEGVTLSDDPSTPTEFVFVLPPMNFSKGFGIAVVDIEGNVSLNQTSNEVKIERNVIQPMATLNVKNYNATENQKIYYTTSDGSTLNISTGAPTHSTFKEKIVSNTYDAEKGQGFMLFAEELTEIDEYIFSGNSTLTSITIPESVVQVGKGALKGCNALEKIESKLATDDKRCLVINNELVAFAPAGLSNYTIPNGITRIGAEAFSCSGLKSVRLPDSITHVDPFAFSACTDLTSFYGKGASEDYRCLILDKVLVAFARGYDPASYTIPSGVTEIGESAFSGMGISSIIIPEGVTKIGEAAFYGCRNLDFGSGSEFPSSLTTIGKSAFATCDAMTAIYIPTSVTTIGENAFSNCTSLSRVIVQNAPNYGVDHLTAWCKIDFGNSEANPLYYAGKLYRGTLWDYSAIGDLYSTLFSKEITEFKDYVFYGNLGLTSLSVPDQIKKIGKAAFCACRNLETIALGTVIHIGEGAFASLPLKEVTIPETVTEIGASAFYNCRSLTYVYCNPTNPPTAILASYGTWDAFEYHNSSVFKIIVPEYSSYINYKEASGWSEYASSIYRIK